MPGGFFKDAPAPAVYGASYKSTTTLTALGVEQVFSAASNVNGAVVHRANSYSYNNAGSLAHGGFVAKSVAPTTLIDGDVIAASDVIGVSGTQYHASAKLEKSVFIPSGKGLYFVSSAVEAAAYRNVLYTLL